MNDLPGKPSFTQDLNPEMKELIEKRKVRPEIGAIWKRNAKTSNTEFLSLKLTLTKEKLQALLAVAEGTEGVAETNFVAFPNKFYEENTKRPFFRIYEELNNGNDS